MAKRWVRAALCALWLGLPSLANAQLPYGPGEMSPPIQEPLPVAAQEPLPLSTPVPTPQPGELPALTTQGYTIGGDHTGAFGEDDAYPRSPLETWGEGCLYFGVGSRAMQRGTFGHRPLAVLDPQNLDTGIPPLQGSPLILDQKQLDGPVVWGPQLTLGFRACENLAFEVTGFYLPQVSKATEISDAGRLDLPFINPPLGFEGDNGLWLQSDRVILMDQSTIASVEANVRCQPVAGYGLEWIFGARYFDLRERFGILTDDDGIVLKQADPLRTATYSVMTHNRIVGPQAGVDWEFQLYEFLAVGMYAKGAVGANFLDADVSLTRGDGFEGPSGHRNSIRMSEIAEVGMYLDWFVNEKIRVRAGWAAMWIFNAAVASDQIDFDLSHTLGQQSNNGSLFYQGPTIEVHFSF